MAERRLLFVPVSLERRCGWLCCELVSCFLWRIFFLRDFSTLHTEQRIHVSLPVPHDTAQFAPPLIPGTENLSKRNGLACQFRANRSAQEPLIVEDADLGHVTRIESQRRIVELDFVRAVEGTAISEALTIPLTTPPLTTWRTRLDVPPGPGLV